jgi:hypothetical protein
VIIAVGIAALAAQKPAPPAAAPIAVTEKEAATIRDAFNAARIADLQFQNALKDAKIQHGVPPSYVFDFQHSAFVPPQPAATPATKAAADDKPTP